MGMKTTVPLSVLDLSPIPSGRPASSALHDTVALARAAESFGYQRYWLAEHHNIGSVASSAPMVMIATVAAATSTIRVGSGGIMLPNHAPLAVAESFRVLEGLHPGRIDLGVGRAPGTDQLTAYALRRNRVDAGGDEFPQQFSELLAYVDGFPDDHPFKPLRAIPDDVPLPPLWILGSSLYGGHAAAAFAYATGVGHVLPVTAIPLHALATLVAYSRVHTGVHYPGDVMVGAAVGTAVAQVTTAVLERILSRRQEAGR